jgi:hypothetical protein
MEAFESGSIELELKYCERCGGLGLRPKGSDLVFCTGCARAMAGLTPNLARHRRDTKPRASSAQSQTAFWSEGGNA